MNVAIALWDEVDVLGVSGPGRLFARLGEGGAFYVYTVAETNRPITTEDFLTIVPEYAIDQCPAPDILVVPGGGDFYVVHRKPLLRWLRAAAEAARAILAVSQGLDILKAAGVPGFEAGTEGKADPRAPASDPLVTEQGKIIAAVSAGAAEEAAIRLLTRLGGDRMGRAARSIGPAS